MRILGLDIGSKSCGIAISDSLNVTAQGLENFIFEPHDWNTLIERLKIILNQYQINTIVVGYPYWPSGDKTPTAKLIDQFIKLFKKQFAHIKIVLIDEYMSTKNARAVMREANLSSKRQKKYKDQIAAQLILGDYLATLG